MQSLGGPRRALIVDDEPEIREILRLHLEDLVDEIDEAGSGREALEKIEWKPPHLILSDFKMPSLSGLELLRFLEERKMRIPVIMISGFLDEEKVRDTWRAGVFEVLDKPIHFEKLTEYVKRALSFGASSVHRASDNLLNKAAYDSIEIFLPRHEYALIEQKALERHLSVTSYVKSLIEGDLLAVKSANPLSQSSNTKK